MSDDDYVMVDSDEADEKAGACDDFARIDSVCDEAKPSLDKLVHCRLTAERWTVVKTVSKSSDLPTSPATSFAQTNANSSAPSRPKSSPEDIAYAKSMTSALNLISSNPLHPSHRTPRLVKLITKFNIWLQDSRYHRPDIPSYTGDTSCTRSLGVYAALNAPDAIFTAPSRTFGLGKKGFLRIENVALYNNAVTYLTMALGPANHIVTDNRGMLITGAAMGPDQLLHGLWLVLRAASPEGVVQRLREDEGLERLTLSIVEGFVGVIEQNTRAQLRKDADKGLAVREEDMPVVMDWEKWLL